MEETSTVASPAPAPVVQSPAPTVLPVPITGTPDTPVDPAVRFRGLGTNFKAKLIGIDDVPDSRGDAMCQDSLLKLKAAVLAAGRHKQKIVINVSLEGIKIVDILTGEVQHVHPVHRISFIARDLTDRRAFGYVYGAGEGKHQFFGIKTMKVAEVLVLALRDLFQVVFDMKKKEIEEAKTTKQTNGEDANQQKQEDVVYAVPVKPRTTEPAQLQQQKEGNLFDLEQQLTTIQEGINNIDSIGPWSQDTPTSPDTPGYGGDSNGGDLFGIANLSDISSLSSDFSCASNSVLDYGHAGGGSEQFERSWSSRSANSWQGFNHLTRHNGTRSSSHSTGDSKTLQSVPDFIPSTKSTSSNTPSVITVSQSQSTSIQSSINDNVLNDEQMEKEKSKPENGTVDFVIKPTKDTLKSSSSLRSLPGSDKKSKRSGFFSRSKKSTKKQKNKKEESSLKGKKGNSNKSLHLDSQNISSSEMTEDVKKLPANLRTLTRRESVSSINSVQSCVVPSTTYETNHLSKSRSSLDDSSVRPTSTQTATTKVQQSKISVEDLPSATPSYIIQSSICPRTRPKAKHSERVEEVENNPRNPPMFKSHSNVSRTTSKSDVAEKNEDSIESEHINNKEQNEDSNESVTESAQGWTASFDVDFDQFTNNKGSTSEIVEDLDPFTGMSSKEIKIPLSASTVFDDAAWSMGNNSGKQQNNVVEALASPSDNITVEDFSTDPFSSMDNASPFDGVDPFATVEMEDPLADPFSVFEENDIFENDVTEKEQTFSTEINFDEMQMNSLDQTLVHNSPTFPAGSDELISSLADNSILNTTSADSSSLTSGMSTPINTQSPVHSSKILPSVTLNTPPALPPRLPPRPQKKSSPLVLPTLPTDECPNEPPPPLPEGVSTPEALLSDEESVSDEDSDNESFSESVPPLPLKTLSQPPAIPERIRPSSSLSSSSSHTKELSEEPAGETFSQSNTSNGIPRQTSSYSDELFDLASPAAQPAPTPGAKLTREQILSGFGGAPQSGMYPGQPGMMPGQQGMMQGQPGMMQGQPGMMQGQPGMMQGQPGMMQGQPGMMQGHPGMMQGQQGMVRAQYGQVYQQQMPQSVPAMNMFPQGPSPAIPPRPGAMRPAAPQALSGGAHQNPFGDAVVAEGVMMPMSNAVTQAAEAEKPGKNDPFASLTSIGGSGEANKKDMFKNFQMAKAPQPPPRTNPPAAAPAGQSSDFDNYFLSSVGGVPVTEDINPTPAPRQQPVANDPFGMGLVGGNQQAAATTGSDPFASNQGFSQPFDFN